MAKNFDNLNRPGKPATKALAGRILALDLGTKRVGVAVSDELQISIRALPYIERTNWKQLLSIVSQMLKDFDAQALVIGLPLRLDGIKGAAAIEASRIRDNFAKSLEIQVFLQDERLTSQAVETEMRVEGYNINEIRDSVDGQAASIILRDFIAQQSAANSIFNLDEVS
jgi:putative Holliday junction resolvase